MVAKNARRAEPAGATGLYLSSGFRWGRGCVTAFVQRRTRHTGHRSNRRADGSTTMSDLALPQRRNRSVSGCVVRETSAAEESWLERLG